MEEIPAYTRDDYLTSTEPFEYLYAHKENKFELKQLLGRMSAQAQTVGVRNLAALFKAYLETVSGSVAPGFNRTDFTGQALELDCGGWTATDTGIYGTDKMGFEVVACYHPIMPVQRLVNVDTREHKVMLAYRLSRRWDIVIVDRNVISDSRSIIGLSKYGIMVNSETGKALVRYLADVEQLNYDLIPEVSSVGRLGWIEEYGFSPYEEELVFDGEETYRTRFESIREHGSREAWLDCARAVRSGKTPGNVIARIVLAASFASVLVGPCRCLPFFVHLWGGSETGKSLSLVLAASVWANPEIGVYIQTFNATEVGKELGAAFCNSLPLIIDELQLVKDNRKDFDRMIYQLSEGVGRARGRKQGGLQKTPTWRNCVITTGEFPIISANSGEGAVNRTIEVDCHDTKLFDEPKKTATSLYANYGFAGREFVDHLMEDGVIERVQKLQEDLQRPLRPVTLWTSRRHLRPLYWPLTGYQRSGSSKMAFSFSQTISGHIWYQKRPSTKTPAPCNTYMTSLTSTNPDSRRVRTPTRAKCGAIWTMITLISFAPNSTRSFKTRVTMPLLFSDGRKTTT